MAMAALLGISSKCMLVSTEREMQGHLPFCIIADATGAHIHNIRLLQMKVSSVLQSNAKPLQGNTKKKKAKNVPKKTFAATAAGSVETTTAADAGPSALPYVD